jgi:hypothetical protein
MRISFSTVLAYGTLVVDGYLALASIATKMMSQKCLPPFGMVGDSHPSRVLVLLVATWTAALAIVCLRAGHAQTNRRSPAGVIWFVLLLAIIWGVYLPRLLSWPITFFWDLFIRGL